MQSFFKLSPATFCGLLLLPGQWAYGADQYDPAMLQAVGGAPEVANLDKVLSHEFTPGNYRVRLTVNGKDYGPQDVYLAKDEEGRPTPELTLAEYKKMQVNPSASGVDLKALEGDDDAKRLALATAIPDAQTSFDITQLKLILSIPQALLLEVSDDEVPPEEWDNGIPAILMEYQISGSKDLSSSQGGDGSDNYANVHSGINIGPWRLRNNSTLSFGEGQSSQFTNLGTYLERAIPALKSELTLGDTYTAGDTFDSIQLKGLQLATDMDMYPSSMNGFAPTVRGIAKSNAKITVRDHGNIIYQTNVAPGAFVLNNLSPVSTGGTLDVTITEADGSETHFTQSYATVQTLLREKQIKYNLALGTFSPDDTTDNEGDVSVAQLSLSYGLPYNLTLLSGMQVSERYKALNVGLGMDMGYAGAISADITDAKADDVSGIHQSKHGQSTRIAYANEIAATQTTIQLSERLYSAGYYSLSDALSAAEDRNAPKKQITLSVNQDLTEGRSLFISMNKSSNQDGTRNDMYQMGMNFEVGNLNMSVNAGASKNSDDNEWDKQLALNVSGTLKDLFAGSSPSVTYLVNTNLRKDVSQQVGLNGSLLDSRALSYSAQLGYNHTDSGSQGVSDSLGLTYDNSNGTSTLNYSQDPDRKQLTWGLNGGMIMHRHGLTLTPYSEGAQALVSAPGASHVALTNGKNLSTDWRGYAAVPDLSPYSRTDIQFNPQRVNRNVTLKNISATVVPTKDAVVLAPFVATSGRKVMATLNWRGQIVPFGSTVKLEGSDGLFLVGDQGVVYFDGAQESGDLTVLPALNTQCKAHFDLPEDTGNLPVTLISLECV
ncbi:MAG TPA: fimbria/pilus outer membrane usher protein [Scandinavium sp.]|jgi:outer membrane usher protein|uniref:fimbria/pilus outer membrane usher protein n=1 Tax=Scandinavium sp. TaxID=2830653 RepID=UPI002E30F05C|nr:fimbria/pilus outer membrane usher protein [Scandinavium sp.]HEX4501798.1 fimbria/pilus outer membrane usher protein [Scandinavium sp.]